MQELRRLAIYKQQQQLLHFSLPAFSCKLLLFSLLLLA
jgi:hypothetical protein